MKKLVVVVVLALVLAGSVLGGLLMTIGAANPTLTCSATVSAPSTMSVSGQYWTTGVPVNIYVDLMDEANHVAVVTPDATGRFFIIFSLGPISIGPHNIIAKQNGTEKQASFTVTRTQQLDDRAVDAWQSINSTVNNIEGKLDNLVVAACNSTELSTSGETETVENVTYDQIRHVSLTLDVANGSDGDSVEVWINFPSTETLVRLDRIDGGTIGWALPGANGVHTYQFDTDEWKIVGHVGNSGTPLLDLLWTWTAIAPVQAPI